MNDQKTIIKPVTNWPQKQKYHDLKKISFFNKNIKYNSTHKLTKFSEQRTWIRMKKPRALKSLCTLQFIVSSPAVISYLFYQFLANIFVLYPLKIPENHRFSGVFRECKMGALPRNGLINQVWHLSSEILLQK